MNLDLGGKRALVTGAGKGIGREIALTLARFGATVVAVSRTQEDLDTLHSEIGCDTVACDVADASQAQDAAVRAGDIDLLVNNAGISLLQPFLKVTPEAFDQTMAVNVRAALLISQVVAQNMVGRRRGGAIVNVSSQASQRALVEHTSYCASKGALDQLTRVMALELAPYRIRVNAVNPTVTLTPMGEKAWSDPARSSSMLAQIPLGRFAKPTDIAYAVAYLLSDEAGMVTGTTLPIDGGFLLADSVTNA